MWTFNLIKTTVPEARGMASTGIEGCLTKMEPSSEILAAREPLTAELNGSLASLDGQMEEIVVIRAEAPN